MESYKHRERDHYNHLAKQTANAAAQYKEHMLLASYQFCERWLEHHIKEGVALLDYGCGNGIHSLGPATMGAKVTGIDISEESIALAKAYAKDKGIQGITFAVMDGEAMTFADNTFDYVFDGGTFSSLELAKALAEIARVLKPSGALLAIETLGHNPLTNAKRLINKWRGTRTPWAVEHIFRLDDLRLLHKYFANVEVHFFHLFSLFAFPFLSFRWGKYLLTLLERIDRRLLRFAFFQRYAFKIVIIAHHPL